VADIQEGLNAGMWTVGLTKSGNEVGLSLEEIGKCDPLKLKDRMDKAEKKLTEAGAHYVVEGIWDCLPILEKISERIDAGELPVAINV